MKFHDHEYINTLDRIQALEIEQFVTSIIWHRSCYSQFTHANHLKRLQSHYEKGRISPSLISISNTSGASGSNVECPILYLAQRDTTLRYRLAGVSDLIASEDSDSDPFIRQKKKYKYSKKYKNNCSKKK